MNARPRHITFDAEVRTSLIRVDEEIVGEIRSDEALGSGYEAHLYRDGKLLADGLTLAEVQEQIKEKLA